jgi:HTH-type transcriptional regulator, transcriptional repressor of NAD biosynthesis genes
MARGDEEADGGRDMISPAKLKRVTLFGAESAGKTTLANELAQHFNTVIAPEYGRVYTETFGQDASTSEDMLRIAIGHIAGVAEAAKRANRVLIEDTDPVLTAVWSDMLAGSRDPWFDDFRDYADLYLFCDIDLPWVKDDVRYFSDPEDRRKFHLACERELVSRGVNFVLISGSPEQRRAKAIEAVEALLKPHR